MRTRLTRLATLAVVLTAGLAALAPAGASAFQKAVWGPASFDGVNQFPLYKTLGVKIYETRSIGARSPGGSRSDPTEPGDPAYRWPAAVATEIALAKRYGMRVLIQVGNAPAWENGGHAGMAGPRRSRRTSRQFVQAASRKYPTVHMWMIWGEPNRKGDFRPEMPVPVHGDRLTRAQAAPRTSMPSFSTTPTECSSAAATPTS